jgi:hypothetical protein
VNDPVSDPVLHLYAAPSDIVELVPVSMNSVKPPPQALKHGTVVDCHTATIAISRSPAFLVRRLRLGNVRAEVVLA